MGTVTLQTIFEDAFPLYEQTHPLPAHVRKAARAIMPCRTAALGGHVQACPDGHMSRIWYNSCRQRSCPPCAYLQSERWLALQRARLLACAPYHVIFTLPHDLNLLWLANVPVLSRLLFQAARATLVELLADAQYLGAQPGLMAALHTWSPTLGLHPHLHCLVTGGGLTPDGHWQAVRHGFLLPVRGGMAVFRGKRLAAIRQALAREEWVLPEAVRPQPCLNLLTRLGPPHKTKWHVHIRERYAHGAGVVTSLARYLRGGPIKDARLVAWDGERVTFLHRARQAEGDAGPAAPPAHDVVGRRLPPALALACPGAADPGGTLVRPVSLHAGGGAGRLPCPSGPTAGRGAPAAGMADGVCAARGPAPGALAGVWSVARVPRRAPAWGCPAARVG